MSRGLAGVLWLFSLLLGLWICIFFPRIGIYRSEIRALETSCSEESSPQELVGQAEVIEVEQPETEAWATCAESDLAEFEILEESPCQEAAAPIDADLRELGSCTDSAR